MLKASKRTKTRRTSDQNVMDLHRALVDAIISARSDAIVAADEDGNVVFWNPGAERIFGYASADAVGRSLDIFNVPLRNKINEIVGLVAVIRNVTKRFEEIRALKQKLKVAVKDSQA